jgi:hypothetical protein
MARKLTDSTPSTNGRDRAIPFFPPLMGALGSCESAILLVQCLYWWATRTGLDFFKFMEAAPRHPLYRPGDSWVEELGFGPRALRSAIAQVSTPATGRQRRAPVIVLGQRIAEFDERGVMTNRRALISYHTDRLRVTRWTPNIVLCINLYEHVGLRATADELRAAHFDRIQLFEAYVAELTDRELANRRTDNWHASDSRGPFSGQITSEHTPPGLWLSAEQSPGQHPFLREGEIGGEDDSIGLREDLWSDPDDRTRDDPACHDPDAARIAQDPVPTPARWQVAPARERLPPDDWPRSVAALRQRYFAVHRLWPHTPMQASTVRNLDQAIQDGFFDDLARELEDPKYAKPHTFQSLVNLAHQLSLERLLGRAL